jgi:hypothetical protein
MADIQRISLDNVILHFEKLEDPRSTVNLQHPLISVVVIALMAVLAGASGPTAITRWAAFKEESLGQRNISPSTLTRCRSESNKDRCKLHIRYR